MQLAGPALGRQKTHSKTPCSWRAMLVCHASMPLHARVACLSLGMLLLSHAHVAPCSYAMLVCHCNLVCHARVVPRSCCATLVVCHARVACSCAVLVCHARLLACSCTLYQRSGFSVDLAKDGKTLVIGYPGFEDFRGAVRVACRATQGSR